MRIIARNIEYRILNWIHSKFNIQYSKFNRGGFTPTFTISQGVPITFISRNVFRYIFLHKRKLVRGFTLIELMIAVTLFSTTVVIGIGALYSAQQVNIKLQTSHIIMDSMNLSLEVMSRNMRYGSNFNCINNLNLENVYSDKEIRNSCGDGGNAIMFRTTDGAKDDRVCTVHTGVSNPRSEEMLHGMMRRMLR